MRTTTNTTRTINALLWTAQVLLAALFLFAGGFKLTMSAEALEQQAHMSGTFLQFIATMEVLGGLGLVLPWLLGIKQQLTPLAAAGLVIIMVGATAISIATQGLAAGILPFATGAMAAFVARGRFAGGTRQSAAGSGAEKTGHSSRSVAAPCSAD